MHYQHARFAPGVGERSVDLVDHGLVEGVVFARPVQAEEEDPIPACGADEIRCATSRCAGHWSKSTVTVSVIGWAWQVKT
jgi:hypothetical protein